jgi:enolase
MAKIKKIQAREILDSRGNPTLETEIILGSGIQAKACVPSGASCGSYEALELRDNDSKRYFGKGVLRACENVNQKIFPALKEKSVFNQKEIDQAMIEIDGTKNKSALGANAILSVSLACARVAALEKKISLYKYLSEEFNPAYKFMRGTKFKIPVPMFNIFNGGLHADNNLDIQEFMIVPIGLKSFKEQVRTGSEIFHFLGQILKKNNLDTDVGNEGGYAPNLNANFQPFEFILKAIQLSKYSLGKEIGLAIDAGATTFYNSEEKKYVLKLDKISLEKERLIALYAEWIEKYNLIGIEDGLAENDWDGWKKMKLKVKSRKSKVMIVGDDLTVTNIKRIKKAIKENCANAVIIKPNQIGTLTETIEAAQAAQEVNWKIIISHRSGETCDDFISDLAVAVNADFIKTGGLSRSERLAKYNRLMKIEEELS